MECIDWSRTWTATNPRRDPDPRYAGAMATRGEEDALCVRT